MRIGILSCNPRSYSIRRLVEAGRSRDHTVTVLDTLQFAIDLDKGRPSLFYKGKKLPEYDIIIPRIGTSLTYYGTAVVRQFEQMGVFCVNSANGIADSRDKLRSMQIFSRHDIGIPATEFVKRRGDVIPAIERVGGAPVIIKLLEGTQGVGVILADHVKIAEAIIETLQSAKQNVLIQKFITESRGKDIRAFVVGDRVVAAMRRVAQGTEFRSNVHRGGRTEPVELDPEFEDVAVRAAQIMNLQVAGVDLLESSTGPQIMEVNSSPGLEGIEGATKLDIAGTVIDFAQEHVRFPELDIRQRLTVSRGYGVSEIHIPEGSAFVGQTIADSELRAKDLLVLSIHRGKKVIPNPRESRVLEVDDKLLCFGKREAMKDLIPERKRRIRKRRVRKLDTEIQSAARED